jgi:hypothetical protein
MGFFLGFRRKGFDTKAVLLIFIHIVLRTNQDKNLLLGLKLSNAAGLFEAHLAQSNVKN